MPTRRKNKSPLYGLKDKDTVAFRKHVKRQHIRAKAQKASRKKNRRK